jgi:hypothetical protein
LHVDSKPKARTSSIHDPQVPYDPIEHYAAVDYQLSPLAHFFEIYCLLFDHGVLPPPNVPVSPTSSFNALLAEQMKKSVFVAQETTLSAATPDTLTPRTSAELNTGHSQLLALAGLLGLTTSVETKESPQLVASIVKQCGDLNSPEMRLTRLEGDKNAPELYPKTDSKSSQPGQQLERLRQKLPTLLRMARRKFEDAHVNGLLGIAERQGNVGGTFEFLL